MDLILIAALALIVASVGLTTLVVVFRDLGEEAESKQLFPPIWPKALSISALVSAGICVLLGWLLHIPATLLIAVTVWAALELASLLAAGLRRG